MPPDILQSIVAHKKELLESKRVVYRKLKDQARTIKATRYHIFREAISRPGEVRLIAEIKKASPSQGLIREEFQVLDIARIYAENGAAAISVLTEDHFFQGRPDYVRQVSDHFPVPVLTKDFIIDEVQIYEAFLTGTSAVLLIAAILEDAQLKDLMACADDLDLDCLVEIHDQPELDRAVKAGAGIIGINNRNLHTFEVDLAVSEALVPGIPRDKVIVSESGIRTHDDLLRLKALGANAVLIGETFMRAGDIGAKVREVMTGQERQAKGQSEDRP